MTFDPTFKVRPLSWSAISSFEYDPAQWYRTYILNEKQSSREMTFGSLIDKQFQDDDKFFPEIPRGEMLQHKMKAIFDGIHLVGVPDILSIKDKKFLADLKTGKKKWDKKRADETGQITFYLFLLFITKRIRPEEFECAIFWLPTVETKDFKIEMIKDCKPVRIDTKRTMSDLLMFGKRIKDTVKKMQEYVDNRPIDMPSVEE